MAIKRFYEELQLYDKQRVTSLGQISYVYVPSEKFMGMVANKSQSLIVVATQDKPTEFWTLTTDKNIPLEVNDVFSDFSRFFKVISLPLTTPTLASNAVQSNTYNLELMENINTSEE